MLCGIEVDDWCHKYVACSTFSFILISAKVKICIVIHLCSFVVDLLLWHLQSMIRCSIYVYQHPFDNSEMIFLWLIHKLS